MSAVSDGGISDASCDSQCEIDTDDDALKNCSKGILISSTSTRFVKTEEELGELEGYREIELEGLQIEGEEIRDLESLHCLERFGGALYIKGTNLIDMRGLESLEEVAGTLFIGGVSVEFANTKLDNLDGFDSLKRVIDLRISWNIVLREANLDRLEEIDNVYIHDNPELENISFSHPQWVGDFSVNNCQNLKNILFLGETMYVKGLSLRFLDNISNLDGLENVKRIGYVGEIGSVVIESTKISSLSAFDENLIIAPDVRISFIENGSLPTREIDRFLAKMRENGWTGESEVRGSDDEAVCE